MWVGVVEGLGVVGMWCVASAVSVVGRWLGVCVCGTWLCGEKNTRTLGGRLKPYSFVTEILRLKRSTRQQTYSNRACSHTDVV